MELKLYQERVFREKNDLEDKIFKLTKFTTSEAYKAVDPDEQIRLKEQLKYMCLYREVLCQRINAF